MTFQFEKLLVYQKAVDFADHVCATTEQFTRGYGFLVDQLNRAALSISANIAEGNGRLTKADRSNAKHRSKSENYFLSSVRSTFYSLLSSFGVVHEPQTRATEPPSQNCGINSKVRPLWCSWEWSEIELAKPKKIPLKRCWGSKRALKMALPLLVDIRANISVTQTKTDQAKPPFENRLGLLNSNNFGFLHAIA
jgi:23S rRNA-intervening sequence protein